ncbi:DUF397 domain-containing protein [Micromonospora endophytica]|uniref:DUF397 domain-containing protein n=1 Tax=Micromonospora endophytica TaxID=515350 RepID=A0A2W2BX58_9ACTN|nr:DUF397 domain-containing protein [Micromonospora endophytica]PZF85044.1 DUF397 domain-containing protein [Micromonospora endophytica]RIW40050.1 DUF397 domain-containing protein [Micromonospora endophytica]BCJ57717.1 hypothetical protein Jiend_11390 [Micromonospora endophytica]
MNDLTIARWRKSSRSAEGECVEVADRLGAVVGVRDSKDSAGPALLFGAAQWRCFIETVKTGQLP